ncbi:MAG: hypothetical protein LBN26_09075 [Christensenellaceae bacterium]|jgi:hypothetical protein|nr:hypothetical protein [Christensenellaceae bacterium]
MSKDKLTEKTATKKKQTKAILVYEGITAQYNDQKPEGIYWDSRPAYVPQYVNKGNHVLRNTPEGQMPWCDLEEGWKMEFSVSTGAFIYFKIEKSVAGKPWQYWGQRVQARDAEGHLRGELIVADGDPANVFVFGEYVFVVCRSGILHKCDVLLNEIDRMDLSGFGAFWGGCCSPYELIPGTSFGFMDTTRDLLTVLDYIKMDTHIIACPADFQFGVADHFNFFYGMVGMSFKTVTALDSTGAVADRHRVKGNMCWQDFFLRDGYAHAQTNTLGIHEFYGTRENETITRIYRFEPV